MASSGRNISKVISPLLSCVERSNSVNALLKSGHSSQQRGVGISRRRQGHTFPIGWNWKSTVLDHANYIDHGPGRDFFFQNLTELREMFGERWWCGSSTFSDSPTSGSTRRAQAHLARPKVLSKMFLNTEGEVKIRGGINVGNEHLSWDVGPGYRKLIPELMEGQPSILGRTSERVLAVELLTSHASCRGGR